MYNLECVISRFSRYLNSLCHMNILQKPITQMNSHQSSCCLLVVIVNYRTPELTIDCLQSLEPEIRTLPGAQVTVVDNHSEDNSVDIIYNVISTRDWHDWVKLIPSKFNGGFSYGNNLAIREALRQKIPPNYFFLLNPDTQVRPGALKILVEFMENCPDAGIAGSSIEEQDGKLWPIAFRFPTILSELDAGLRLGFISKLLSRWVVTRQMENQQCQVDWLPGCCLIIRGEVFENVGLMDENYFLYFEETDFCLQTHRAGWSCWYVPESRIMNIGSQSTGVYIKNSSPKRLPQYWFESRRRYFVKNHGVFYAALADTVHIFSYMLWKIRQFIQRKSDMDHPYFLWDLLRNSVIFECVAKLNLNKSKIST